jgi:hypothetical protein
MDATHSQVHRQRGRACNVIMFDSSETQSEQDLFVRKDYFESCLRCFLLTLTISSATWSL